MDTRNPTENDISLIMKVLDTPNMTRIKDYLAGNMLGPGSSTATGDSGSVSYWRGYLLPEGATGHAGMVRDLRRAFVHRNVILGCLELMADGMGIDEADWAAKIRRKLDDGEAPTEEESSLMAEADALLTAWWNDNNISALVHQMVVNAGAFGRASIRPRLVPRYIRGGTLARLSAQDSLKPLRVEACPPGSGCVYTDPVTLEDVALLNVDSGETGVIESEFSYLDDNDSTVLCKRRGGVIQRGRPINLRGTLWLLELKLPHSMVTSDVLANQDALNVALTMLNSNTNFAAWSKFIAIGVDPPVNKDGSPAAMDGPGSATYLQQSFFTEQEERVENGQTIIVDKQKPVGSASVQRLEPSDPKALLAAAATAEQNILKAFRQSFLSLTQEATPSGRSREVASGPFLRHLARVGQLTERLVSDLLEMALDLAAEFQGQPGRYKDLEVKVLLRQKIVDPSPDAAQTQLEFYREQLLSAHTIRNLMGLDPDAEAQQVERELAVKPRPLPTQSKLLGTLRPDNTTPAETEPQN